MHLSAKWPVVLFFVLLAIAALFAVDAAHAQNYPQQQMEGLKNASGQMDSLLTLIQTSSQKWYGTLKGFAVKLFWLLAGIQFIWTFFPLVFRQADFADLINELVRFILVIGFFMALLQYTDEWTAAIINSFQEVGFLVLNETPGLNTKLLTGGKGGEIKGLAPGEVFRVAVEIANRVSQVSVNAVEQSKGDMLGQMLPLAGMTIMLCFVFISAFMALTLIESWFVINASVLFMGLGGSDWTRQYARQMLTYAFSVGVKMFVMIIVVGLIMSSVAGWEEAFKKETNSVVAVWTTVGLAMVAAFFSKSIPDLVQGLITGAASGGSAAYQTEGSAHMMRGGGGGMMGRMGSPDPTYANSPALRANMSSNTGMDVTALNSTPTPTPTPNRSQNETPSGNGKKHEQMSISGGRAGGGSDGQKTEQKQQESQGEIAARDTTKGHGSDGGGSNSTISIAALSETMGTGGSTTNMQNNDTLQAPPTSVDAGSTQNPPTEGNTTGPTQSTSGGGKYHLDSTNQHVRKQAASNTDAFQ